MPLFLMLAVALSRQQQREVKEKWPLKNLILLRKCLASASELVQSLMSWSGMTGAFSSTFPLRQQNLGGSFGNLFTPQWWQFRTGFSMCVSLGMLLFTFSYGSGTSGLEAVSSSGGSLWTTSSDSFIEMTFEHKNKRLDKGVDV